MGSRCWFGDPLESGHLYFGLPASSSHTLTDPLFGVGIANQMMAGRTGTSVSIGTSAEHRRVLLLSPLVGLRCRVTPVGGTRPHSRREAL